MPRSPPGARGGFTCHQGAVKAPGGGGPWASGPWNWPQTRLASKGTPATEITAKPRSPQRHVGHIFSMTKTAPDSGLFEGGKSPLPLPPTTTPAPTSIATHPQLPPPPKTRHSEKCADRLYKRGCYLFPLCELAAGIFMGRKRRHGLTCKNLSELKTGNWKSAISPFEVAGKRPRTRLACGSGN